MKIFKYLFLILLGILYLHLLKANLHKDLTEYNEIVPYNTSTGTILDRKFDTSLDITSNKITHLSFLHDKKADGIQMFADNLNTKMLVKAYSQNKLIFSRLYEAKITASNKRIKFDKQLTFDTLVIEFDPYINTNNKLTEIVIYTKNNPDIIEKIVRFCFEFDRGLSSYAFYIIIIIFNSLYTFDFVSKKLLSTKSITERYMLNVANYYLLNLFLGIIIMYNLPIYVNFAVLILTISLAIRNFLRLNTNHDSNTLQTHLLIFLFSMILLGLNLLIDYADYGPQKYDDLFNNKIYTVYPYKNFEQDFVTPFSTSKILLNKISSDSYYYKLMMGINNINDRSLGFSVLLLPFLNIFGNKFFIFQVILICLASNFISFYYLLVSKIFNKAIAFLASLYLALNHYILFFFKFTETKFLSTIFIFGFYYFLIENKKRNRYYIAGIMFMLAYLMHQMAVIYALAGLYFSFDKNIASYFKNLMKIFAVPIIGIFIFNGVLNYKFDQKSAISNYILAYDYDNIINAQSQNIPLKIDLNADTLYNLAVNKYYNTLSLFLPDPNPLIPKSFNFYRNTYIGSIGVVVFLFGLIEVITSYRKYKFTIFIFIVAPIVLYIGAFLGFYNDLGLMLYLTGSAVFIYPFFIIFLDRLKNIYFVSAIIIIAVLEVLYAGFIKNYYFPISELVTFYKYSQKNFSYGVNLLISGYMLSFIFLLKYYNILFSKSMEKTSVKPDLYDKEYYQKYNHGYNSFLLNFSVMDDIKKELDKIDFKEKKVLDVACGRGEVMKYIIEKGGIVIGFDYSKDAIEYAIEVLNSAKGAYKDFSKAIVMDAKNLSLNDNEFDYVVMLDIVEHLHDWELDQCFNEVHRVLKPGGEILIHTTPNKFLLAFPRFILNLVGVSLKSSEFHVNEQTYFSLKKRLNKKFKGHLWMHKDTHYWFNQMVYRPKSIKMAAKLADFIVDNFFSSFVINNTPLKYLLATDIWFKGKKI